MTTGRKKKKDLFILLPADGHDPPKVIPVNQMNRKKIEIKK